MGLRITTIFSPSFWSFWLRLLALFGASELDLLAIETANDFKKSSSFIEFDGSIILKLWGRGKGYQSD